MDLHPLLQSLNAPILTFHAYALSAAELLGFITGALCVWLLARQNIWNWPIGIANNLFFLLMFFASGLYADSGLQIVYIVLSAYGWWTWIHGRASAKGLAISRTERTTWTWLAAASFGAAGVLYIVLARMTDSTVPGWDAFTTALSLAATYGQCRKLVESWWIWIAADLIYIPLYAYKNLYLTSVLYSVFLLLCIAGLMAWRRDLLQSEAVSPLAPAEA